MTTLDAYNDIYRLGKYHHLKYKVTPAKWYFEAQNMTPLVYPEKYSLSRLTCKF